MISASDPFVLDAVKGLAAGSVNTVLAIYAGARWPEFTNLASAMSLGLVSYGLGLVPFIFALRYLGTARTGAYYGTAPFIGAIVAAIFLGTRLTAIILIAGLLMAFGAWLHLAERHEHDHTHVEFDHEHTAMFMMTTTITVMRVMSQNRIPIGTAMSPHGTNTRIIPTSITGILIDVEFLFDVQRRILRCLQKIGLSIMA